MLKKRSAAKTAAKDEVVIILGAAILRVVLYSYPYRGITLTLGGCSPMNQSHMRLV